MMRALPLLLSLALAACGDRPRDDMPLAVSVIGPPAALSARARPPLTAAAALLTDATAQGLVAFDAGGQVEPALAERWIVANDGLSILFRLGDRSWPDGSPVTAQDVARRLRTALATDNPYRPITGAIAEVTAVTPQVVELTLASPRPNLLQVLGQPEFALVRRGAGAGPMLARQEGAIVTLSWPAPVDAGAPPPPGPVRVRGERAALAVARFAAGRADGVLGGRFATLGIARAADPRGSLRIDPAVGLFGLTFTARPAGAFTADPDIRRAMTMAVDRDAIVAAFAVPGWSAETRIVSGEVEDMGTAARPDWDGLPLPVRRAAAAAAIAGRRGGAAGQVPVVRIAMPPGPGARLLFARIALDWRAIGIVALAVPQDDPAADLRLIDDVAPGDIASWYLRRFACAEGVPCAPEAETVLVNARRAPTLVERAVLLGEADRIITRTVPFIPIARPLRWSLVGPRLTGWRESVRGFHPLRHLRE